jgi:hypothetical protein
MAPKRAKRLSESQTLGLTHGAYEIPAGASVARVKKEGGPLVYVLDGNRVRCFNSQAEVPVPPGIQSVFRTRYFK